MHTRRSFTTGFLLRSKARRSDYPGLIGKRKKSWREDNLGVIVWGRREVASAKAIRRQSIKPGIDGMDPPVSSAHAFEILQVVCTLTIWELDLYKGRLIGDSCLEHS
jgi:hypothetical protein